MTLHELVMELEKNCQIHRENYKVIIENYGDPFLWTPNFHVKLDDEKKEIRLVVN